MKFFDLHKDFLKLTLTFIAFVIHGGSISLIMYQKILLIHPLNMGLKYVINIQNKSPPLYMPTKYPQDIKILG